MNSEKEKATLLAKELDILTKLNSKIHIGMDFDKLLDEIIDTLRSDIEFDGCNFALVDDEGIMRVHKILYSKISNKNKASEEFLEKIYSTRWDVKTSNSWACQVVRNDMEIYHPEIDLKQYSEEEKYILQNYGITGLYYLPIKQDDKILGVMRLHNYERPMILTEFQKNLLRRRAAIVARAVENSKLHKELQQKNDLINQDLLLASRIQKNFLPQTFPDYDCLDIACRYVPMIEIGGDYYDFCSTYNNEKSFGVIITDVSGHGVPAAFITSMVKMSFQSEHVRMHMDEPSKVLELMNKDIFDKLAGNFVTAYYVYFDLENMRAKLACAGHNPLYVINKKTRIIKSYHPKGRVLGLMNDSVFYESEIPIKKDDRFILYTDGLTEATNAKYEEFEDYLEENFLDLVHLDAEDFCQKLIQRVMKHALYPGKENLEDDLALVVLDMPNNAGEDS